METETPDFIPPTLWPPNSLDLNPGDYKIICSVIQENVYRVRICDVNIVEASDKMDQRIIDESAKKWRARLRACVSAKGGKFENKILTTIMFRNESSIFT
jgi:hypothetical protein